jgi:ATP-dependent Lon protease
MGTAMNPPATVPPIPIAIPIAGFKDVYDVAGVDKALQELPSSANEAHKNTYEKMLRLGGARLTVKPSGLPAMDALYEDLPNFSAVLDDIKKHIALVTDSRDAMELPPMLLLGPPGIGKTHFGKRLSQLLATGFGFVSMSSMTAGWVLSGSSSQWKNAKPGKVFDTFLNGSYANPVMLVDEIDKAGGDSQYDPLGALYSLLEHDTAVQFIDEFVEVPIDTSDAVWIATANEAARIPDPILNRMNVYHIEAPDHEGAIRIALSIYGEIRNGHDWGRRFPDAPAEDVLEQLAAYSPREMRRVIFNAFGNAKLAGRDEIGETDIAQSQAQKKQRIGF